MTMTLYAVRVPNTQLSRTLLHVLLSVVTQCWTMVTMTLYAVQNPIARTAVSRDSLGVGRG